jgi:eukaryotic-like serine/threonine-protein kinase
VLYECQMYKPHHLELMHRDFKPENILIGPETDVKICDFGLSQTTNSIFVTGRMGTPIYAAPEVFLIHNQ